MFAEFINTYGLEILYALITAIAGYLGIVAKKLYTKYIDDKTKASVCRTVVLGIEQVYKDFHGEEKLNLALEAASDMLAAKGIQATTFELTMLIEAAVAEFNNAFTKAAAASPTEAEAALPAGES